MMTITTVALVLLILWGMSKLPSQPEVMHPGPMRIRFKEHQRGPTRPQHRHTKVRRPFKLPDDGSPYEDAIVLGETWEGASLHPSNRKHIRRKWLIELFKEA